MGWKQIEATPSHLTYLILSGFLISYALFSAFVRNRLHLSEPPLALATGIIFGPHGLNALSPVSWNVGDNITQEFTRVIVGVQCFVVAVELPSHYFKRHWSSILMLLGPVMTFSWLVVAAFICLLLKTDIPTALMISACLTPTDPVLAASVLSNSTFSNRVPNRLKRMLSAESGCNDGISFPFIYVGLSILTKVVPGAALKEWLFITVLWQCTLGSLVGILIGFAANRLLRFADKRQFIAQSSFLVFYLLLAVLAIGIGSTLGLDDFLVAFGAGIGFSNDGWFHAKTRKWELHSVIDLLLNSTFFVYFGAIVPWSHFNGDIISPHLTPHLTPWRLTVLLVLVLAFRRIPIVLLLKRWIADIKTYREAVFCGHFGPMGVGALFLAMEARAQLETGTSLPLPHPPSEDELGHTRLRAVHLVWPVVCFVVVGSTIVHGLSVAVISVWVHFTRGKDDRAGVVGGETEPFDGMVHDGSTAGESDEESEDSDHGAQNGRIALPG